MKLLNLIRMAIRIWISRISKLLNRQVTLERKWAKFQWVKTRIKVKRERTPYSSVRSLVALWRKICPKMRMKMKTSIRNKVTRKEYRNHITETRSLALWRHQMGYVLRSLKTKWNLKIKTISKYCRSLLMSKRRFKETNHHRSRRRQRTSLWLKEKEAKSEILADPTRMEFHTKTFWPERKTELKIQSKRRNP